MTAFEAFTNDFAAEFGHSKFGRNNLYDGVLSPYQVKDLKQDNFNGRTIARCTHYRLTVEAYINSIDLSRIN